MRVTLRSAIVAALIFASMGLVPELASAQNAAKNKALVQGMMDEVFNRHDLSKIDNAMAEGYVQHNPFVPQGRAGFRGYMQATFAAVPDWRFELRKISAEGDLVWTYGSYSGTPKSQWGQIPPTGKSFNMDAADLWRIKDGYIVEHWDVLDVNGMLRQLGLLPPLGARAQPSGN